MSCDISFRFIMRRRNIIVVDLSTTSYRITINNGFALHDDTIRYGTSAYVLLVEKSKNHWIHYIMARRDVRPEKLRETEA